MNWTGSENLLYYFFLDRTIVVCTKCGVLAQEKKMLSLVSPSCPKLNEIISWYHSFNGKAEQNMVVDSYLL